MVKRLYALVVLGMLSISLLPMEASASHMAGAEITYEWITGSTYRINYRLFRDCSGITEPSTVSVCYRDQCNTFSGTVILSKAPAPNGLEVGTGCPGFNSTCNGGSNPGYREWLYTNTVTLPSQCNWWTFSASINARNGADNLAGAAGQNLYVETTFDNLAAQGNSSPYFTVKPINYMCINSPYSYNNGAVDPNGDSLSFELIQPLGGGTTCNFGTTPTSIGFSSPIYNLTNNPIGTGNTFNLDPSTGQMTFTPNAIQTSVVTLLVREWRNGVQIGTIMRDMQYVVMQCTSVPPTLATDTFSLGNVHLINGQVQGCANEPLSFCFDVGSTSNQAVLVVSSNNSTVAPGSNITYTGQGTDSVRGCFSWTPSMLDTGLNILTITVKDSNCVPPGIILQQTFTIPLYIWPPTVGGPDTAICAIDSVQLDVSGGTSWQWSVLGGGSPLTSLSCTNCKNPWAKPTVTTKYVVTSTAGNIFCEKNVDTVEIVVLPQPNFDLGADVTTCVGDSIQLDINLVPEPNTTYQVFWDPPTYLSSDTVQNPIAKPTADITYVVTVVPGGIGQCGGRDTLDVAVLQGYTIFNADSAICLGATVQINAIGDPRYTYTWDPPGNVVGANSVNPAITPTVIGPQAYTLTASYPGCTDSVRTIGLDVQPVPQVFVGADQILCYGDTVHLDPVVTPSDSIYSHYTYNWNPPTNLDNPAVRNPVFYAYSTTTSTLSVSTPAGCLGSDDIAFNVVPTEFINLSADTAICAGDTAMLRAEGGSLASLVWYPQYWLDDSTTFNPQVWPVTTTTFTVIGRDTNFCLDTNQVTVEVKPQAVVDVPDSVRIYPGQSYQLDPTGNALYFEWFPPHGLSNNLIANPVAQPEVDTRYRVIARTEFGCSAVDSIDIFVNFDSYIDVPNAFVPGSGHNNRIKVARIGDATLKSFVIYNRWGAKVFESVNVDEGWDGTLNGEPQPMGVYIYTVEAVTPTGRKFVKQGNITLIR